jgi:predicted GTPase
MTDKKKIIIMGAAGRDFHNFNVYYRENNEYEVVAFTATQIPDIAGRKYPPELSGELYPNGIPIYPEEKLTELIKENDIDEVVFAYSDLPYEYVMGKSAVVNAAGADFTLLGPESTMIKSTKPLIAVCAVRTGCGKSQVSREIFEILRKKGLKVASIRHPMPYDADLTTQICQRFASYDDLDKYNCTIEEREEYEPYIDMDGVIFAGVDYGKILSEAEKEADVIIWDGGNNDFSFYKPDLLITLADPHRPGHEISYYPGEVNTRSADVVIINKANTANKKKVLVIEDGPTVTHGSMKYGAGTVAANDNNAGEIIDPRNFAVGSITETFNKYNHLTNVLPAMGYSKKQISELEETINNTECDVVVSGTPIDLRLYFKTTLVCFLQGQTVQAVLLTVYVHCYLRLI